MGDLSPRPVNHIVLMGDSIFDNARYVGEGESVLHHLSRMVEKPNRLTLLAVDGDVTSDVNTQLLRYPQDTTHVFVSCGGNDALNAIGVLSQEVATVGDALDSLSQIRRVFRADYRSMLRSLVEITNKLTVCTVYNAVPDTSRSALTALALFNEVILEEASSSGLPVIDLRNLCKEESDYSSISPIEPSGSGGKKIAAAINRVVSTHDFREGGCRLYS